MQGDGSSYLTRSYSEIQPSSSIIVHVPNSAVSCSTSADANDATVGFSGIERRRAKVAKDEITVDYDRSNTSTIYNHNVFNECGDDGYKFDPAMSDELNKNDKHNKSRNHNLKIGNQSNTCSSQISIPATTSSLSGAGRRHRILHGTAADREIDNRNGLLVALQQKLFENYHFVAYTIVIGTYFIAFCEYVYLRLISCVFPDRIVYRRPCEKHINETIVRNEVHYASATVVFLTIGIFQLVCFFMLTVSEKWLDVRRTFTHFISMEERLRHELAFSIKRVMFTTVFPTFFVMCAIFYMVGMRDPVEHVGSQVLIYFFDGCVVMYFLAFPIVCLFFHPDIRLCQKRKRKLQVPTTIDHRCATIETHVYGGTFQSSENNSETAHRRKTNASQLQRDTVCHNSSRQSHVEIMSGREKAVKRAASFNTFAKFDTDENTNNMMKNKKRRLSHPCECENSTRKVSGHSNERRQKNRDKMSYQHFTEKRPNSGKSTKETSNEMKKYKPQRFQQRFIEKWGRRSDKNKYAVKNADSKKNNSQKNPISPHSSLRIATSGASVRVHSLCPPSLQNRLRIDRYHRLGKIKTETANETTKTDRRLKNNKKC